MRVSIRLIGIFGIILAILITCSYLSLGNSESICFGTPFPSYSDVEHYAYLKLPASARNIEFRSNAVNRKAGCTIWVKFDMDSKDFDTFKSSTYVKDLSSSTQLTGNGFEYFKDRQGWRIPLNALAGHDNPPAGASGFPTVYEDQWIVIDTSDAQKWTIYLIVNKEWI
jgi:hypothetical protein